MPSREDDYLLLALFLAAPYEDDPELSDYLYTRLNERFRDLGAWDPMVARLLSRRLRYVGAFSERRAAEMREVAAALFEGFRQQFTADIERRLSQFDDTLAENSKRHEATMDEIASKSTALSQELHSYVWLTSLGADFARTPMVRSLAIRIFVASPVPSQRTLDRIAGSVQALCGAFGFEMADEFPGESGSWWKRFYAKTRQAVTSKDVHDRLEKAEHAIQAKYLDKPQAEANKLQAEAASALINSLGGVQQACIQVGSLLVIKRQNSKGHACVASRTLSMEELKRLEQNQSMLQKPEKILNWLGTNDEGTGRQ